MSEKVTFPELVGAIASATHLQSEIVESYLKELFSQVADTLRNGDDVNVQGLGSFNVVTVSSESEDNVRSVTFVPDKSLAQAINSPFEGFIEIELNDEITENSLESVEGNKAETPGEPEKIEDDDVVIEPTESADEGMESNETDQELTSNSVEPVQDAAEDVSEANEEPLEQASSEIDEDTTASEAVSAPVSQIADSIVTAPVPEQETSDNNDAEQQTESHVDDINDASSQDEETESESSVVSAEDDKPYVMPEIDDDEERIEISEPEKKNNSFFKGFLWGALTMFVIYLIAGGGIYMWKSLSSQNEEDIVTDSISDDLEMAEPDSGKIEAIPTEAAQESVGNNMPEAESTAEKTKEVQTPEPKAVVKPVDNSVTYDTITKSLFLSRISRKHYGHSDFWVYIYEENKSKIKNPNAIPPGTVVVIPPAQKYGIDKNSDASIRAARKKAVDVLSHF